MTREDILKRMSELNKKYDGWASVKSEEYKELKKELLEMDKEIKHSSEEKKNI